MKLTGLHIENFGCLSGVTLDFSEGINEFLRENGAGKSTLAAFLRIMFYGFDAELKKDGFENERQRFRPWQGGTFGGSITFSYREKQYRIERTFGLKPKEDVLNVFDAATGLSDTSLGDCPGITLFGVDAESFRRTVFIGQGDAGTSVTGPVSARLGSLVEASDDITGYEQAMRRLSEEINRLNPDRATGSLYRLREEIAELKAAAAGQDALKAELSACGDRKRAAAKERIECLTLAGRLGQLEEALRKESLSEAEERELSALYGRFPDGVPSAAELGQAQNARAELKKAAQCLLAKKLSPEEKDRLSRLRERFSGGIPDLSGSERVTRALSGLPKSFRELSDLDEELSALTEELLSIQKEERKKRVVSGLSGALAFIVCIVLSVLTKALWPCVLGGALAVLTLLWLYLHPENDFGLFEELSGMEEHRDALSAELEETTGEIRAFFRRFPSYGNGERFVRYPAEAMEGILRLRKDAALYRSLLEKDRSYRGSGLWETVRKDGDGIRALLKRYGFDGRSGEGLSADLDLLINDSTRYLDLTEKQKRRPALLAEAAALREQKPAERAEELGKLLRELQNKEEMLSEKLLLLSEKEEELAEKEQLYLEGRRRFRQLHTARELLKTARASLLSRYSEPAAKGFSKYLSAALGEDRREFRLNADGDILVTEAGMTRGVRFQSPGLQDLAAVCMRLALADAMYPGEKPFLILDDPFVNLDEEKTKKAAALMREASESYQVLYFTCHQSRLLTGGHPGGLPS